MKSKLILAILLIFTQSAFCQELSGDDIFDIKQNAYALYNTNHLDEAYELLNKIPDEKKDAEAFLILANIEEDKGD